MIHEEGLDVEPG